MLRLLTIAVLCATFFLAAPLSPAGTNAAGLTVVSTTPVNNATNVSTGDLVISVTFSDVLDTTTFAQSQNKGPSGGLLGDLDTIGTVTFSADYKTVFIPVRVSASKAYFLDIYAAKSPSSGALVSPYALYFTTAASFPPYSVSGRVSGGVSGISPGYSIIALSTSPLGSQNPVFAAGAVADGSGDFTIPYVSSGTYYPVAARDLNNDGQIDPSIGDIVGLGNPVTVTNANVSGVAITYITNVTYSYQAALDSLAGALSTFPTPHVLRVVQAYEVDSTGKAGGWEFFFTTGNVQTSFYYSLETFGGGMKSMDTSQARYLLQEDPISAASNPISALPTPAAVDSFLARAERGGGGAYRPVPMTWNGFDVELNIGDLYNGIFWDMVPDSSKFYLGVQYWYGIQGQNQSQTIKAHRVLGDWTNGTVLGATAVSPARTGNVATRFSLGQNYPNPFNPSTNIEFSVATGGLVKLEVYDILGRLVNTLVSQNMAQGSYSVRWDGKNQNGSSVASGVYLYRIQTGSFMAIRKMLLMK